MAGVLRTAERVSPGDEHLVPPAAAASADPAGGPTRFALPAIADIRVVTEILSLCRRALDGEGDVIVDCGDVERVDAAVLQCLGALHAGLADAERTLRLAEPTDAFGRAVEVLGFARLLGMDARRAVPAPTSNG